MTQTPIIRLHVQLLANLPHNTSRHNITNAMASVFRHEVQRDMFSKVAAATIRVQCQFSSASPILPRTFLTSCLRDQRLNNRPRFKTSMSHTIRRFSQSSRFNTRMNQDEREKLAKQLSDSIRAKSSFIEQFFMWEAYVKFTELKKHGLSDTRFYKRERLVFAISLGMATAITAFLYHGEYLDSLPAMSKEGSQKDEFKEKHGSSQ